jgi:hypothetical protein
MITEQEVWDALPQYGYVRDYVTATSQWTDAHIAHHLSSCITSLTQCVPPWYCVPFANPLYANMFALAVGSSGSRKTAAINIMENMLRESSPTSLGEQPGSTEGLAESLRANNRQLIVYGEFGDFLSKSEQGYLSAMKAALTGAWDCLAAGRALANSRRGQVSDPRLSIVGGVAVDLLERHTEQSDWTGGFMARFLTFHAEREREFPSPPLPDRNKMRILINQYKALSDPSLTPGSCLWIQPGSSVEQMWNDWHADMRVYRLSAGRRSAAACSRATSIAAKIAILLEWDLGGGRSGSDFYITEEVMRSTIAITNLHLRSVLELGEMIASTKDMKDRAIVLRVLGQSTMPMGVILKQSEMLKKRGREILETLIEERTIEQVQIGNETCYRRSPENHIRLLKFVEEVSSGNVNNSSGLASSQPNTAKIIPLPPKPVVNLVPDNIALEEGDLDDIDWSKYDG